MENKNGFGFAKQVPVMYPIFKIKEESSTCNTFFFKGRIKNFKPGQFIMFWIPGKDEKPFTISYIDQEMFGITIEKRGKFTEIAADLKEGELVGIRGPYGTSFTPLDNSIIVAGGLGIMPLRPLIYQLKRNDYGFTLVQGARSEEGILFINDFKALLKEDDYIICTDDGSLGERCFTTVLLERCIHKNKPSIVYAVGPEAMMAKVYEICKKNNIRCELSLERYMKCGFGLCGQCACADKLVCLDGPVFGSSSLGNMKDFGNSAYLKDGRKVSLKEYYDYKEK